MEIKKILSIFFFVHEQIRVLKQNNSVSKQNEHKHFMGCR